MRIKTEQVGKILVEESIAIMTKPIPPMMPGLPLVGNVLDFRKDSRH